MAVVDAGTPADQDEFWLFGYGYVTTHDCYFFVGWGSRSTTIEIPNLFLNSPPVLSSLPGVFPSAAQPFCMMV